MSFPWKDDHMETFLRSYRSNECLWNNKSEHYHRTNIRDKAYKSIQNELNLPNLSVNDIRLKIKTVRTRYSSELAKIRKSEKSGAGTEDVYKPRLFWFTQADSFLKDVCIPRESSSDIQDPLDLLHKRSQKIVKDELEEDSNTEDEAEYSQNGIEKKALKRTNTTIRVTPASRANKRQSPRSMNSIHGVIHQLLKVSSGQNKMHEFDVFCESLAIQLKKMPLRQALECQGKLQAVMTEHRLSILPVDVSTSHSRTYSSTPSPGNFSQTSQMYPETIYAIAHNGEDELSVLSD